ncbi:hypothetical protein INT46_008925 [Mucor plumbeus]|uniref:F-box domain-containing protein n=1 Tax=Mucor plumbeus TaxID=97098 RepID=A0A8H7QIR2_9FUNG|nr:hypothetical protein INT46_008925 [Mucor plumbeus]
MDKLPKEIALIISEKLTHLEKRECALTCRLWCNWFRKNGLFTKVSLNYENELQNSSKDVCLPMLKFFQTQNYGQFVLELEIKVETMNLENFVRLPIIFPNVKKLHWEGTVSLEPREERSFEKAVIQWSLQDLNDFSKHHVMASSLLQETSLVDSLKNLTIVYTEGEYEFSFDEKTETEFFAHLSLSQSVQSFTAVNPPFSISFLSRQHDTLNTLTSLKLLNLNYCNLDDDDDDVNDYFDMLDGDTKEILVNDKIDKQMKKAELKNQVVSVQHIEVTVDPSNFCNSDAYLWIEYFSKTYPNLVSFSFNYLESHYPTILYDDNLECGVEDFICGRSNLKKYSMQFEKLEEHFLDSMEKYNVALEDLTVFIDDKASISQFTFIRNSTQANSLIKLSIKEKEKFVGYHEARYGDEMFSLLQHIPQLKEIEIDTFRGSLSQHNPSIIVSLLNNMPLIETIITPALKSIPTFENIIVSQPSNLVHLDISYCEFELSTIEASTINQVFENIFSKCPSLETFSTQINVYKTAKHMANEDIALVFSFKEQSRMKSIQIRSLYKTYFKFIVKNETTLYHQKYDEMRKIVPKIDENEVYIEIEALNASIIDTMVMSDSP